MLVALYALCVITPNSALALSDLSTLAHCMTDDHRSGGNATPHHADENHDHFSADFDDNGQPVNCCGLFCVTAIAQFQDTVITSPIRLSAPHAMIAKPILGRGPDRIDRPPRSFLSL